MYMYLYIKSFTNELVVITLKMVINITFYLMQSNACSFEFHAFNFISADA